MTTADELHARALDRLVRGDTPGGIDDLRQYLATEPEDDAAWVELGTAYATIEHWPEATRAFARAVDIDGNVVVARLGYARALVRLGKLDDAAFQLLQATKIDPDDPRPSKELGVVFYDKRLYEKAETWLTKAARAAPDDARTHYALGLAHEARRDMAGAIAAYREAVSRDPRFVDAYKTLADALASLGEHERAIEALESVLALERNNELVAQNLDVLRAALDEIRRRRLLGKALQELEASALVQEGQLRRRGESTQPIRYGGPLVELHVTVDVSKTIEAMLLVLLDPEKAAKTPDDTFGVTVVAKDGRHETTDYATAISLTFLREALGCTLTHAAELYTRLLASRTGDDGVLEWGDARVRFASVTGPSERPGRERHGIAVERGR